MGEGLTFATLATLLGKKLRARYGSKPVTISAVGYKDGERWVMATDRFGGVILGTPNDFTVPERKRRESRVGSKDGR